MRRRDAVYAESAAGEGGEADPLPRDSAAGLLRGPRQTLIPLPRASRAASFRGRHGDLVKVLWHDRQGMCLLSKRLERARLLWPLPADVVVMITPTQLGYFLEGIGWRAPRQSWVPEALG
jgi:transposase